MKKFLILSTLFFSLCISAQTTSGQLKTQIDTDITNKTTAASISKTNVGSNMKAIVDYVVQVITAIEGRTVNGHALSANVTVTKSDVGLALADNTSDAGKPVSTAQAAVNALKAPITNPAFLGVPTGPTASPGANTTQLANTAFVKAAIDALPGPSLPEEVNFIEILNANSNLQTLAVAFNMLSFNDNTNPIIKLPTTTYIGQSLFAYVQGNGRIGDPFNTSILIDPGSFSINVYDGDLLKFTRIAAPADDIAYSVENLRHSLPYRVYSCRLSQTGTAAPTNAMAENTLGNSLTWARTGTGVYTGTFLSALFNSQKTFFPNRQTILSTDGTTTLSIKFSRVSDTVIKVETFSNGTPADAVLNDTSFEVKVYREFAYQ